MTEPKILVGVVTYEAKDYIFDECMKHIAKISYPKSRVDVMIVDNTANLNYFYKLMRRGYKNVFHVDRGANSREALTKSQNKIRNKFLEGDYTHLLLVESDLLVPPDTITRLLSYSKPVVGSTYNISRDKEKFIPCIFLDDVRGAFKGTRPLGVRSVDEKKVYNGREIDEFFSRPDKLQRVHGVGFGCTLIERKVIETVGPFWCDERMTDKHSDVYFYLDCSRESIPVYVDTSGLVPHFPSDWDKVSDR